MIATEYEGGWYLSCSMLCFKKKNNSRIRMYWKCKRHWDWSKVTLTASPASSWWISARHACPARFPWSASATRGATSANGEERGATSNSSLLLSFIELSNSWLTLLKCEGRRNGSLFLMMIKRKSDWRSTTTANSGCHSVISERISRVWKSSIWIPIRWRKMKRIPRSGSPATSKAAGLGDPPPADVVTTSVWFPLFSTSFWNSSKEQYKDSTNGSNHMKFVIADTFNLNPQYRITLEDPDGKPSDLKLELSWTSETNSLADWWIDYDPKTSWIVLDDDDDDKCTVIVALMQKNRRAQRKFGLDCLTIGYTIYHVSQHTTSLISLLFFFYYFIIYDLLF